MRLKPCTCPQIWVKPSSEMQFLYGNNILKSGLARITENTPAYTGVVVYNMADIPLGFGVTAKSTNECRALDPNAVVTFHQADCGACWEGAVGEGGRHCGDGWLSTGGVRCVLGRGGGDAGREGRRVTIHGRTAVRAGRGCSGEETSLHRSIALRNGTLGGGRPPGTLRCMLGGVRRGEKERGQRGMGVGDTAGRTAGVRVRG